MSMIIDHKVTQRQLLVILPKLHTELDSYPNSFMTFEKPALSSLSDYWLPPFNKETSPYGIDVMKKLKEVTDSLDQCLLDKCLKDICKQAAIILKRQRGDAYGFGDTVNSPDMICKNLSEAMLDDPEATNTKKIENYLGNLHRILTTTGPQGFDKATDDLILKYGKDIILDSDKKWTSKETRKAAKELISLQRSFKEKQEALKNHGLEDADVAVVTTVNKVQRVVTQCKMSHGGPVSDVLELHDLVEKYFLNDGVEKKLHSILNLEVRYRKFTMTNVKDNCSLFRQQGIALTEKVKNLELLLESQSIGFNASATMDDLENAVMYERVPDESIDELEITPSDKVQSFITKNVDKPTEAETSSSSDPIDNTALSSFWPPKKDEFVCALLEDGFYIGQVDQIRDDQLHLSYLMPKSFNDRKYWVWPEREDKDWISQEHVIEVYPSLRISRSLSSR